MYFLNFAHPHELFSDGFHAGVLRHDTDKCVVVGKHVPRREPAIPTEPFFVLAERSDICAAIVAHHPVRMRSWRLPDEVPALSTDCWVHDVAPQEPAIAPDMFAPLQAW